MADTLDTSAFRRGLKIEIDGEPWEIVEFQHVKPGKGSAFVRTRIKNLITGRTIDKTFKSGDVVGKPDIEEREMQYLYLDGDHYHFMDNKNYEQTFLTAEQMGEAKNFIKDNTTTHILFFNGKAIGVTLPNAMDLKVVEVRPRRPRRHRLRRHQAGHAGDRLRRQRARSSSTRATSCASTPAPASTSPAWRGKLRPLRSAGPSTGGSGSDGRPHAETAHRAPTRRASAAARVLPRGREEARPAGREERRHPHRLAARRREGGHPPGQPGGRAGAGPWSAAPPPVAAAVPAARPGGRARRGRPPRASQGRPARAWW